MNMAKVLYIKANPKNNGESRTFQISERFVEAYRKNHPEDEIITLDLYKEDIHFLTKEDIDAIFGPKTEESRNHPVLRYTYQFAEADKYIFAVPMWNLGIPAILKAYFDYVTVSGITFKYTEYGAVGLLDGKKAVCIMTTGGEYMTPPMSDFEMANRYLRTLLGFMGVKDVKSIIAQRLDMEGEDIQRILGDTLQKAEQIAQVF